MPYNVLIVDDEEPARDLMMTYAQKLEELAVVAIVNNAFDAKRILKNQTVHILLTDIQMDDLTGIDLVKNLKNPPITIFTTAYSEYALEGYDLDIIDYLVKPISFQRFCRAIDKAIELLKYTTKEEQALPTITATKTPLTKDYFFIKTNRKLVKVNYADILFLQSYGEYVKVYTKDDVLLALQTTSYMEAVLPPDNFVRIHRSSIINIQHIKEIEGNQIFIDQHRLVVSKRMREAFMTKIRAKGIV